MPMTKRQLDQVREDYAPFLSIGAKVVSCTARTLQVGEACDICKRQIWDSWMDGKEIVVESPTSFPSRFRLHVCRNGMACRRRALKNTVKDNVIHPPSDDNTSPRTWWTRPWADRVEVTPPEGAQGIFVSSQRADRSFDVVT